MRNIDVFGVHDCFTLANIPHYEDLGLCKKGKGRKFIENGISEIDRRYPINPSGDCYLLSIHSV